APLILNAHLDTVESTEGLVTKEKDGAIYSAGPTVLGADDRAGVAALLEGVESALESGVSRGDIFLVFTVCEEQGVRGARFLETGRLPRAPFYSFDAGEPAGTCINSAAGRLSLSVTVRGKEAPAWAPEEGVDAIAVTAKAADSLKWGRTDEWSSMNTGVIKGGRSAETVAGEAYLEIGIRSVKRELLEEYTRKTRRAFCSAAEEAGACADIEIAEDYPPLDTPADAPVCRMALLAAERAGLAGALARSGAGFDANRLSAAGFEAVSMGIGYKNAHSPAEYIEEKELAGSALLVRSLIECYGKER
ncbi:MAG: M20/M25/M40 family metallo-hydrolase, partial [Abditibacteriota bacterium]|nr:M20/M25/M40 family metallo-hydrolase [Abditibacteriota bacterium]